MPQLTKHKTKNSPMNTGNASSRPKKTERQNDKRKPKNPTRGLLPWPNTEPAIVAPVLPVPRPTFVWKDIFYGPLSMLARVAGLQWFPGELLLALVFGYLFYKRRGISVRSQADRPPRICLVSDDDPEVIAAVMDEPLRTMFDPHCRCMSDQFMARRDWERDVHLDPEGAHLVVVDYSPADLEDRWKYDRRTSNHYQRLSLASAWTSPLMSGWLDEYSRAFDSELCLLSSGPLEELLNDLTHIERFKHVCSVLRSLEDEAEERQGEPLQLDPEAAEYWNAALSRLRSRRPQLRKWFADYYREIDETAFELAAQFAWLSASPSITVQALRAGISLAEYSAATKVWLTQWRVAMGGGCAAWVLALLAMHEDGLSPRQIRAESKKYWADEERREIPEILDSLLERGDIELDAETGRLRVSPALKL